MIERFIAKHFLIFSVVVTCYNPSPLQGWGDGTITADGSKIPEDVNVNWCALSHDFFDDYGIRYGDTVFYNGKKYIVKDKMNKRWKKRVDILQHEDFPIFKNECLIEIKKRNGK